MYGVASSYSYESREGRHGRLLIRCFVFSLQRSDLPPNSGTACTVVSEKEMEEEKEEEEEGAAQTFSLGEIP